MNRRKIQISSLLVLITFLLSSRALAQAVRYLEPSNKGFSAAVIVGETAIAQTAQLLPLDRTGRLVGEGDTGVQIERVYRNIELALGEAGTGLDQLVKLNIYGINLEVLKFVRADLARRFTGAVKPAVSYVVTALPHPGALVAIDAVAAVSDAGVQQEVRRLRSSALYDAGSAHVAVQPKGGLVFVAGHPKTGTVADGTESAMASLHQYLEHMGFGKAYVLQIKCFMQPMTETGTARDVIGKYYEGGAPPLAFVEWISERPTEIALVAFAPYADEGETLHICQGPGRKPNPAQFSDISRIRRGGTVFMSTLYSSKPSMPPKQEIRDIFRQVAELADKTGSSLRHIANVNYYVSSLETNRHLSAIRPDFYASDRAPAANRIAVHGVGMKDRTISFDITAATGASVSPLKDDER